MTAAARSALAALVLCACAPSSRPAETPPAPAAGTAASSPIRRVDFLSFRYGAGTDTFTVVDGKRALRTHQGEMVAPGWEVKEVVHGDVTGDGEEDAVVAVTRVTAGSGVTHRLFVYTLRGGRPALLWDVATGDRASGGLRRGYAEGGGLVVELNGRESVPGREPSASDASDRGLCCPTFFTRTRMRWTGSAFRVAGTPRVLPVSP